MDGRDPELRGSVRSKAAALVSLGKAGSVESARLKVLLLCALIHAPVLCRAWIGLSGASLTGARSS